MRSDFKPGAVVSCHTWSADGSRIAVCPNNNELHIYFNQPEQRWALEHVLQHHDKLISGVDWSWSTGGLVTCSHDLNAYVLKLKDGIWKPDMVITRLRRAALCVRWSPCGSKFAVGGAGKEVSVCFTEKDSGWWGAAIIRQHQSSVMGVAWHPSGTLLATACADGRCRVFSALPKDEKEQSAGRTRGPAFGELLHDVDFGAGWGTAISWSPNGLCIAVSCHQSTLGFLRADSSEAWKSSQPLAVQRLAFEELPFRSLVFLSDRLLVAAGFGCEPFLCSLNAAAQWGGGQRLTGRVGGGREALTERQLASDFSAKLALFRSSPSCKVMGSKAKERFAAHSNAVVEVRHLGGSQFSTAATDGRVVMWDADS